MEERLSRLSNEKRARWRTKCREHLSKHIWEALQITINPSEVRLITSEPQAQYMWKIDDDSLQPLFNKHLSKHSVGAYMQLCQEVGKSFYAVRPEIINKDDIQPSPSDRLQILQQNNADLTQELEDIKKQVASLQDDKRIAEEKILTHESSITEAQVTIHLLQQDVQQWMAAAEYYQFSCIRCSEALKETILSLQELDSGMILPRSTGGLQ
ncbi:hypothetical protein BO94DRAFT_542106 [Aspergillus sclerotioniger CBS 115572]|uniref:Uncharacterized protein n=1 Tax=Aspergillus sclerotioniger CBS 115572 TaxID=1450535 RepID=A0A317XFV2_9EURO|nr:hypothetical protein BO94DRAFT_542106 [Aspergillus sclerotioniger CBS 115572]PWY96028.1 hypothetical protein BO94DRAFT_542106 [Aspergillus sclerotioniger CBS 115572]